MEQIADDLELWFRSGAAEGFDLATQTSPGGLRDFVEGVVPELQRRGLFRKDYETSTLRGPLRPARRGPFRWLSAHRLPCQAARRCTALRATSRSIARSG